MIPNRLNQAGEGLAGIKDKAEEWLDEDVTRKTGYSHQDDIQGLRDMVKRQDRSWRADSAGERVYALTQDLWLAPRTDVRWFGIACDSSSRGFDYRCWPPQEYVFPIHIL